MQPVPTRNQAIMLLKLAINVCSAFMTLLQIAPIQRTVMKFTLWLKAMLRC